MGWSGHLVALGVEFADLRYVNALCAGTDAEILTLGGHHGFTDSTSVPRVEAVRERARHQTSAPGRTHVVGRI